MRPADAFHDEPDEAAEQYVMNRMPADLKAAYEMHLLECPDCADAREDAEIFINAIRQAASEKPEVKTPKAKSAC